MPLHSLPESELRTLLILISKRRLATPEDTPEPPSLEASNTEAPEDEVEESNAPPADNALLQTVEAPQRIPSRLTLTFNRGNQGNQRQQAKKKLVLWGKILEIVLRYFIAAMETPEDRPKALPHIQALLNSATLASTGKSPHELMYGLKLQTQATLLDPVMEQIQDFRCRPDARECIKLAAMDAKCAFDRKHEWIAFRKDDMIETDCARSRIVSTSRTATFSSFQTSICQL